LDGELNQQLRGPDRAASGELLLAILLALAGRRLGQLVALVTVEPDPLARRAMIDGRADQPGEIVLEHWAAAARTRALGRARDWIEGRLEVRGLAREQVELARVEPRPVAHGAR